MSNDELGLNLTYPKTPSPVLPAPALKEINDANIPVFMTGIILPHAICTLFLFARIASRLWVIKKWFIDDTLIFLSWLFSTALCIVYSITATTPNLLAAVPNETDDANPYIMRTYLGLIYYQICLCLTKFSILAFYLRVFKSSRARERRLAWGTVAFVLAYSLPLLLMSFLQCHPVVGQFFGKPMVCFGFPELLISSASLHSATDVWLIAMVAPCVARLDLPKKQKFALAAVLSLGVFVVAASMVRLQLSLHRHYRPGGAGVSDTLAFFVMTILECDLALICASAPTLRPLLARLFPALMAAAKRRSLETRGDESFDLTSLTYHGYPWTEPSTPFAGTRNASVASHLNRLRTPAPPVPALSGMHHSPTVLSLRSAVLGAAPPRSRGRNLAGDGRLMLKPQAWEMKRSSSIYSTDPPYEEAAAPAYYEQYGQHDGVVLKTMRLSLGTEVGEDLGDAKKDPLSPNRWSPMSGLSGDTYAVDRSSGGSAKSGKDDDRMTIEIPPPVPPRRPRRPDDQA
ncbi:integral membrane protein [Colletotrichum plurivorum]|uniref:Integral membrane protein n=1 Tax=Colletotrichum plurivorum TaxID=2175906 RepID=A0A8H6KQW5_9PEZI|nr:integral membrane protein [Colletotrichum plurivorum]